jgi:hypothetical protein
MKVVYTHGLHGWKWAVLETFGNSMATGCEKTQLLARQAASKAKQKFNHEQKQQSQ